MFEAKAVSIEVYVDARHLGPDLHTEEREDSEGPSQELYGRYHGRVPVTCNTLSLVELNEARLSLVQSFIMLLAPVILCHKEIVTIKSLVGGFGCPSWFFMA